MKLRFLAALLALPVSAAEVFELGAGNFEERPGGSEADAIVGDYLIRNDRIEAVISGNLPQRRANMSTFYGADGITPGCLYDLTLRGADNDQITIFSPCGQRGPVNHVRIVDDGKSGEAVLETFVSSTRSGGLAKRHEYRLRDGWAGLLIVTTLANEGKEAVTVPLGDQWTQMRVKGQAGGIHWADAVNPDDKCGYALAWVAENGATIPGEPKVELAPGAGVTVARFLSVGRSPAEAFGEVARRRDPGSTGTLELTLLDAVGQTPVPQARILIGADSASQVPAYPDAEGRIVVAAPGGPQHFHVEERGRPSLDESGNLPAGGTLTKTFSLAPRSSLAFDIEDESGTPVPCKVQFRALGETPKVDLGPSDRAHGCVDQYHSETGSFEVALPPGRYEVTVTRGPEFHHLRREVELAPGTSFPFAGTLKRAFTTPGWVSSDFHTHTTQSGDNTCGTDDRLINLAAEHIEFAPTTEHNRLYNWGPHLERLGLTQFLKTVPGLELTGAGAHLNAFPFTPDPTLQDGGAPEWKKDPRLNAITLRDWQRSEPDRWVHVNHPDMIENFVDRDKDGRVDGGFAHLGSLLDGLEVLNYSGSEILSGAPYKLVPPRGGGPGRVVAPVREFIWLQLLNQGLAPRALAVCDSHHVHGNGVGGWRTYVRSSTDEPAEIDWREMSRNAKAGRMFVSSGPFLEVETASGAGPGDLDRVSGRIDLKVKVSCADWLDIDRVQVLVNGRQPAQYNFTREQNPAMFQNGVVKFENLLALDLQQDAHLIVVAIGENHDLSVGFGTSNQARQKPVAYHNPIFVDVDGGGYQPNGDTLGHDLPVGGLSVDQVQAILGK